jgi:hypothetical protein
LFCGLCEKVAGVLDFLLQQGPSEQQRQNGCLIGAGSLTTQLRELMHINKKIW